MPIIQSGAHGTPPYTPKEPKEPVKSKLNERISQVVDNSLQTAKDTAYKGSLFVAKVIAIPVELSLLTVFAAAAALSFLPSLAIGRPLDNKSKPTPFNHIVSIMSDIWEIIKITYHLGAFPESEQLQLADDKPDSPSFVVIQPNKVSDTGLNTPILYAPGLLDSPNSLRDTCRKLANDSGAPVYIVKYRTRLLNVQEHAEDIARVEERIIKDTNCKEVVLIGHSLGGVNTGLYVQKYKPADVTVKLWITLASPLTWYNSTLSSQGKDDKLKDMPSLHIYSLTDKVVPTAAARDTSFNEPNHVFYACNHNYNHLSMRSTSEVTKKIQEAFNTLKNNDG